MDRVSQLEQSLRARMPALDLRAEEPMSRHTAFRIGGPARLMALPKTASELSELCKWAAEQGIAPYFMGNGSNLLVADQGLSALVVKTCDGLSRLSITDDGLLFAESGALLSKAAQFAKQQGLSGLEFAHGIPGTVGGAITMNAGAYGGEMKDVVWKTAFCHAATGEPGVLEGADHGFVYRGSAFSNGGRVITGVYFRLTPDDPAEIAARMEDLARRRRESQPLDLPSAGSTFRRPEGHYAAALIDRAGLKGLQVGGAQVSPKHAGFVVNVGGATCADVLALIGQIKTRVKQMFDVELELEVKVWGADVPGGALA